MARPKFPDEQKKREGEQLREKLRAARELGIATTQESLAAEMGITQGTFGQWTSGVTPIPDRRLIWLGRRLGFDPMEIRPTLNDYFSSEPRNEEERQLLEAYRSDPGVRRAIDAIAEMAGVYQTRNNKKPHD